jgi:hypothetical protein
MHLGVFTKYGLMVTLESYVPYYGIKKWVLSFTSVSDTHLSFQNHTLVTGGEDGKINSWPIHPLELETEELIDEDDADGDELMDVDMPSPKGRKRERAGDNELVRFFLSRVYSSLTLLSAL